MNFNACHWGCTTGKIKFKANEATLGRHSLLLTEAEISNLDRYFTRGKSAEEALYCDLPIEISFQLLSGSRKIKMKEMQIYPCIFGHEDKINPHRLVSHLTKNPKEVPYWRLSLEEQNQRKQTLGFPV